MPCTRIRVGFPHSHKKIRNPLMGLFGNRHLDQLQYYYATNNDQDPDDVPSFQDIFPAETANKILSEEKEASSPLQPEAAPSLSKNSRRVHSSKIREDLPKKTTVLLCFTNLGCND